MKAIIYSLLVFSFISCNTSADVDKPEMAGVYSMQSQTIDDGTDKTTLKDLKQLKIYTDKYFMYVQANRANAIYSFGLGTYSVDDSGYVIEKAIYSASDSTSASDSETYKLDITTNVDGYSQFIPDITIGGQKATLTEVYKKSGTATTTPLDGVWKETNYYVVNGNDSMSANRTQYKAFYHGYFMYGQYYVDDSTGRNTTGMGYGSFKMENDHQIMETDLNSSNSIIPGQVYTIEIEMIDENNYKQTILQKDGSKYIEVYKRLKE